MPDANKFLQTLIDAVAVGSLYALISLGYTLVYGVLKFINFAHADLFALGAWLSLVLTGVLVRSLTGSLTAASAPMSAGSWLVPVVLVVGMMAVAVVGFLIERFAYRPLRSAPRLNVLITAIGVSLLLQNLGQLPWLFGNRPQAMPALVSQTAMLGTVGGVAIRTIDVLIVGSALTLMVALHLFVFHTRPGMALRAVSHNTGTASLMGVNVDRTIALTFIVGSALAAAAGYLYALKYPILKQTADSVWVFLGLKAFVAAVVGGIGNIQGAMLGGLFIGLIEFFGVAYVSDQYRDVYVFGLLIAVLLFKPTGILGKSTVEKV